MSETPPDVNVTEMTAEIVSAYVRNNSVPVVELPALLQSVHDSLNTILNGTSPAAVKEPPQPMVPIKRSVTHDYIVCLEDGKRFKSLKRHLQTAYGLSPQDYRDKWGLPRDYPMVAPAYAGARSELAKSMGLGRKAAALPTAMPEAGAPEAAFDASAPEPEISEPELALDAPVADPEAGAEPDATDATSAEGPSPEPVKKPRRGRAKAPA